MNNEMSNAEAKLRELIEYLCRSSVLSPEKIIRIKTISNQYINQIKDKKNG